MNKLTILKRISAFLAVGLMAATLFSACSGSPAPAPSPTPIPVEDKDVDNFLSEDTAIVVSISKEDSTINFQNVETGLRYTLKYDGATVFTSRKGQPLSVDQLTTAGIADITFRAKDELIKEFKYSSEYFCINNVENFEIYNNDTRMRYLGDQYVLDNYLVIAQDNRSLELMEIHENDMLTIYGKDNKINSISVDTGHGYLRLENDSYFIGGFIEVGEGIIVPIEENMLLTVPEGQYTVLVSNDGIVGKKNVTIGKNQEVTLDLGDIDVTKKFGNILFIADPADARVYIDGEKEDIGGPIQLEYGVHQLIVMADGYDTLSEYINVGSASASVNLTLNKSEGNAPVATPSPEPSATPSPTPNILNPQSTPTQVPGQAPSTGNTTTVVNPDGSITTTDANGNTSTTPAEKLDPNAVQNTAKKNAYVYIDAPVEAEVYVDGSYVGIAPTSFKKNPGGFTVTLRKDGYQTKSYSINLEDDKEDVRYSFSELTKIQ